MFNALAEFCKKMYDMLNAVKRDKKEIIKEDTYVKQAP